MYCMRVESSFGSLVEHYLIIAKDQSKIHQFGKKVSPGLFLGYALYAGGIWKGDTVVADIEEMEEMDASELHARRLNAEEVLTSMKGDNLYSQSQIEQSKSLEEINV